MLKINNISKQYNEKTVLDNCSLEIESHKVYGLLGKNGAGKSTLFKLLLNLITPTNGSISIENFDSKKNQQEILKITGSIIEQPKFYLHLNAYENLSIHLSYMDFDEQQHKSLIDNALTMVGLQEVGNKKIATYSLGMKQRLAIARAIVHQPKLIILDEPLNGLDPKGIKDMREMFQYLSKEKQITIIFSSHILSEVIAVADNIVVLQNSHIVVNESKQVLVHKYKENLESVLIQSMEDNYNV